MYVFDTNVVYYLGRLDKMPRERLRKLEARRGSTRCAYTPLAVTETFSGLVKHPDRFRQLKRGARRLSWVGAACLCEPEHQIAHIADGSGPVRDEIEPWENAMADLREAKRFSAIADLAKWIDGQRARIEDNYVATFEGTFRANLVPVLERECGATSGSGRHIKPPLKGKWLKAWDSAFAKDEVWDALTVICLSNAGVEAPSDPGALAGLRRELFFHVWGWRFVFDSIAHHGRNPSSNRSDHNDVLLLTYLRPTGNNIIVTDDQGGVFGRLRAEFPVRCISFSRFLTQEGA